jgi:hypothetical protein
MRSSTLSIAALVALTVAAVLPASAQDTSHPAGIYVGSCPVPGNLLVSLWDASPSFLVDGEADAGAAVGNQSGFPVEGSVTVVEVPLADLVATEHAILVHRSQAEMDDYLVCGDVGGVMRGADELPVALAPVGLSPWSGIALLDDEGNGTTTVSVSIFEGPGIDTGAEAPPDGPFPSPEDFDDGAAPASTPPRDDDDIEDAADDPDQGGDDTGDGDDEGGDGSRDDGGGAGDGDSGDAGGDNGDDDD